MQLIPVMKSLESVLPSQGDPNISEVPDSEQWPGEFSAILESELATDKTNDSNEEDDEAQNVLLGFVPAIYGETLAALDVESELMSEGMLGDVIEGVTDFSKKIAQPESSPDVVLLDGETIEGQSVQREEIIEIINRPGSDQTISATKGAEEVLVNPVINSMSEHPEAELNPEKVVAIEASQQEGSEEPVFQKAGNLPVERAVQAPGEGLDVSHETELVEVKEKPAPLSVEKGVQLVEETVGNVKPLSKAEANEIKSSHTKESFEKIFQLDNSPKAVAHVSNDENSHAREDSGSFRSNQESSVLNLQKMTPRDSQVDFAQITTPSSTETVQGTMDAAQGVSVDLSAEVDTSAKEIKPQTVSRVFEDQVMDQVSNSVRLTMKQGGGEARMRLYPESLGELKVELSIEDGVVKAKFLVNNAMVKDVIEENFDRLRDSLTNNGLKVESFSVSVDQQGKGSNLESSLFSQFESDNTVDKETPVIDQHEGLPEQSKIHSGADDSVINIFT